MRTVRKHYVYGSGMHGCLYDYGPHVALNATDAAESLSGVFEFSDARKRELIRDLYLELKLEDGAEYCEINICDCQDIEEHLEFGYDDADVAEFCDDCSGCGRVTCHDEDCGEEVRP